MALTTIETRQLERIRRKIDLLEARLHSAHPLGDSQSSQAISGAWNDNHKWDSKLDYLYKVRDFFEAKEAGEPLPNITGVNLSFFRPINGRFDV